MWYGSTLRRIGFGATAAGMVASVVLGSGGVAGAADASTVRAAATALRQQHFTLTDLGLRGDASAVNERGQIAGTLDIGPPSFLPVHAYLRTGTRVQDLGVLGGDLSEGFAVNDRGHVAGVSSVDGSAENHAVLWRDGQIIDLGVGDAFGINNRDQVVGLSFATGQVGAFLWENGKRTLLETPAGNSSAVAAINDRGDIVGSTAAPVQRPARWRNGHLERLPLPSGAFAGNAVDVNELGQVLISTSEPTGVQGYLLTGTHLRRLGVPHGATVFDPVALNDRGDVVGTASGGSVWLWHNGMFTALPNGDGLGLPRPFDLNNRDVVVGAGNSPTTGESEAVLWS